MEFQVWLLAHAPECKPESAEEEHLFSVLRAIIERSDPNDPKCHDSETLAAWCFFPRARWAGPLPDGYRFPLALLQWIANPAGNDWEFLHACGVCGLKVPTIMDRSHPAPYPFATCPACGGTTSSAAHWQADPQPVPP